MYKHQQGPSLYLRGDKQTTNSKFYSCRRDVSSRTFRIPMSKGVSLLLLIVANIVYSTSLIVGIVSPQSPASSYSFLL